MNTILMLFTEKKIKSFNVQFIYIFIVIKTLKVKLISGIHT